MTAPDTDVDRRVDVLRGSGVWAALSESDLRAVAGAMKRATYAAGDFIIRHGEPGRHLHVLSSGEAAVRVHAENGSAIHVNTMRAGACFGEMSLLSGDLTSADVVAQTACETLMLERPAFDALMAGQPQLLREFVKTVSQRLLDSNVATGAARQREKAVTRFLQDAGAERFSELTGRSPAMRALLQRARSLAETDDPVLIEGEPGTGKEMVARLIHFRSSRREGALLSAECAQISDAPWGDKLFGDYRDGSGDQARASSVSYLDLAAGGTIVLKNIDVLPRPIQERLAAFVEAAPAGSGRRDVRVVATCRHQIAELAATNRVSPALARAFAASTLTIAPMRDRKRDIPELAGHFARKHAERLHKTVPALDDHAIRKLVTFDYATANVRELEDAIQRAVILSDGDRVDADTIFLGQTPAPSRWTLNLLARSKSAVQAALRVFPRSAQWLVAAVFGAIVAACLFAPDTRLGTWSAALVWSAWWPALALSFFFAGRAWCAVCPMASAGVVAQRLHKRKQRVPDWLKRHDTAVFMAGFFAIVWAEEATGMRHSPRATGMLLVTILIGAVTTAVLLPRRAWCRYLCPLGGFAGVCSMTSLVELRPTGDICTAKCQEHACFKGTEHVNGCPMFNHVMFMDSNRHCVMCLDCLRACPNGSPQVNLRLPALDLLAMRDDRSMVGRLTMLLAGLLVAMTLLHYLDTNPGSTAARLLGEHRVLWVTAALAAAALLSQVFPWAVERGVADSAARERFWKKVTAWLPLVAAGFAAYELNFIPGLDAVRISVAAGAPGGSAASALTFTALSAAQAAAVGAGFAVTAALTWKLTTRGPDSPAGQP